MSHPVASCPQVPSRHHPHHRGSEPLALLIAVWLGMLGACAAPEEGGALTGNQGPSSLSPPDLPANQGQSRLPIEQVPGLNAAYIHSQQARGANAAEFHFLSQDPGSLTAQHSRQGWRTRLDEAGVKVTIGLHQLVLGTVRAECGGQRIDLGLVPARRNDSIRNRAEYHRGAIVEWYENGPLGLEQGFTISKTPSCQQRTGLRLEMTLGGTLRARLAGSEIVFIAPDEQVIVRYSHLWAIDSKGKQLSAVLELLDGGRGIAIEIDDRDASYPLQIDPLIYTQQAKLLAGRPSSYALFGNAVALSGDGKTALIGAPGASDSPAGTTGTAYVFTWAGGTTWTQQQLLLADDGETDDMFGYAVALSADGNTALIGASHESDASGTSTRQNGAAYAFVRSGGSWTQQAKLLATDKAELDYFGSSVALSADGNTALVGAWGEEEVPGGPVWDSGAAYAFVRSGGSWTQQAKFLATASERTSQAYFGQSLVLAGDGNTALIGANGESDSTGGTTDYNGAAYAFVRSGGLWSLQAKLLASDKSSYDLFGYSVALSADASTALIGALAAGTSTGGSMDNGAVYVFVQSGSRWTQQAKLTTDNKIRYDWFGFAIALSADGNTALASAPMDDGVAGATVADAGAAYVFSRSGTSWVQQSKLLAADRRLGDALGSSVALSADASTALVGASSVGNAAAGLPGHGTAYVFIVKPNGQACSLAGECISGNCVDGVCCDASCGGGTEGDCQACSVTKGAAVDGTCGPRSSGSVCRPATGLCDLPEVCDGRSNACPSDSMRPVGSACRAATDACDQAEVCTGMGPACPPDVLKPAMTICRPATGPCDVAEKCNGISPSCPPDRFKPNTSICRKSAGVCDIDEYCTGDKPVCPLNQYKPFTAICRPAVGNCDIAENCTGGSSVCPPDGFLTAGTVCRPAASSCDLAEACTGSNALCPTDSSRPDGTPCPGGMCMAGICK